MTQEIVERVLAIDPEALYFTDYSIDNYGNKIIGSIVIKGKYMTQNQIMCSEKIL